MGKVCMGPSRTERIERLETLHVAVISDVVQAPDKGHENGEEESDSALVPSTGMVAQPPLAPWAQLAPRSPVAPSSQIHQDKCWAGPRAP